MNIENAMISAKELLCDDVFFLKCYKYLNIETFIDWLKVANKIIFTNIYLVKEIATKSPNLLYLVPDKVLNSFDLLELLSSSEDVDPGEVKEYLSDDGIRLLNYLCYTKGRGLSLALKRK